MGFKNVLFEWHGMQIAPPSSLFQGNKFRFSFLHSLWLVRYVVLAFATFLTHARGAEKRQLIIIFCQNGMDKNAMHRTIEIFSFLLACVTWRVGGTRTLYASDVCFYLNLQRKGNYITEYGSGSLVLFPSWAFPAVPCDLAH